MTPQEREVMQMALDWIEAQPEPRMIGAWERIKALRTALAQPEKEWVGLTDQEHMQLATEWGCMSADWVLYTAAVERKIKEKNT